MKNRVDEQYKDLVKKILSTGTQKIDRTKVGTISTFGHQMVYRMEDGFPLLTLRKIHIDSFIHEMLWFLWSFDNKWDKFGNCNIRYLLENKCTFWTEWPYKSYIEIKKYRPELPDLNIKEFENKIIIDDDFAKEFGTLGKSYGKQWINYGDNNFNQIDYLIKELKNNPDSRRLILNAWKADEINETLLPPCHMMFQLYSEKMNPDDRMANYSKWISENGLPYGESMEKYNFPDRKLSLQLYQRSCDLGLGQPFNVAEYSLLLHMISQVVGMIPDKLIINFGDVHIYSNHVEQLKKLLDRSSYELPSLKLNQNIKNIYDFRQEDIVIENYRCHPNIKMEVAV